MRDLKQLLFSTFLTTVFNDNWIEWDSPIVSNPITKRNLVHSFLKKTRKARRRKASFEIY